jgi:dTDP-glucose 4,6-dehydratase
MRRILVTGGAGFIGSNFVRMVLDEHRDCLVVNLDKLTYAGNLENLAGFEDNPNHKFVKGDICDAELIESLIDEHKIEVIVNFAAESHVDRSLEEPTIFIDTNVTGTLTLLVAARDRKLERFVQISTDEVYGELGPQGKFTEQTPLSPNSPYSASKAAADHLVSAFGHTWGLRYNITRCSNNYGPYQFPEKLIPLIILNALQLKTLPVYGDGLQVRDWLFVNDHVDAINTVLGAGRPGEVYNVGGLSERTNMQVVEAICDALDERRPESSFGSRRELIKHVADRPGHDRRYAIDCSRLMDETGWKPSVDFEIGLQQTVDWYLENSPWVERVQDGSYQGERLGLGEPG